MNEMKLRMITFTLITLGISLVIDFYVWQGIRHLIRHASQRFKRWVKWMYWTYSAAMWVFALILVFADPEFTTRNVFSALFFPVFLAKLVYVIFLSLDDIRRLFQWIFSKLKPKPKAPADAVPANKPISRLDFLNATGALVSTIPLVLLSKGIIKGGYDYRVRRQTLQIPNLPDAFKGLKIVQLSDIHSGSWSDTDAVAKGMRMVMDLKPDLIFFTGDLVNNKTDEVYPWMDILSELKAPMGVFSIFGNHDYGDYYYPKDALQERADNLKALEIVHYDLGWHLMRNTHLTIDLKGQRVGLIGVDNWGKGRFAKYGDLGKAMQGIPDVPAKLLLSHDPSHWDEVVRHQAPDIDVMFAGHTHGFQFGIENQFIKWSPSQYIYKQWAGLYQEDKQQLYVNRGFGFLGYPGRVGILPEITLFELV